VLAGTVAPSVLPAVVFDLAVFRLCSSWTSDHAHKKSPLSNSQVIETSPMFFVFLRYTVGGSCAKPRGCSLLPWGRRHGVETRAESLPAHAGIFIKIISTTALTHIRRVASLTRGNVHAGGWPWGLFVLSAKGYAEACTRKRRIFLLWKP